MKEGSIPAALIYRIQYKVMNTCASRVLLQPQKGETTLFITDMTKANVSLKRIIKWDEVTLPTSQSTNTCSRVSHKLTHTQLVAYTQSQSLFIIYK